MKEREKEMDGKREAEGWLTFCSEVFQLLSEKSCEFWISYFSFEKGHYIIWKYQWISIATGKMREGIGEGEGYVGSVKRFEGLEMRWDGFFFTDIGSNSDASQALSSSVWAGSNNILHQRSFSWGEAEAMWLVVGVSWWLSSFAAFDIRSTSCILHSFNHLKSSTTFLFGTSVLTSSTLNLKLSKCRAELQPVGQETFQIRPKPLPHAESTGTPIWPTKKWLTRSLG